MVIPTLKQPEHKIDHYLFCRAIAIEIITFFDKFFGKYTKKAPKSFPLFEVLQIRCVLYQNKAEHRLILARIFYN